MQTLTKLYTGTVLWIKIILLAVIIFGIGLVLYYLLGKKSAIMKMLTGVFSKIAPDVNQTATQLSEDNTSTRVEYDSLPTNSAADKTLNAMAEALKALEDKEKI
jgi:hypothetical protein